jgi:hypothetical protein
VLKKSGDGRKLSGTLTRVARADGGADDDYCCPGRNDTGARACAPSSISFFDCHLALLIAAFQRPFVRMMLQRLQVRRQFLNGHASSRFVFR